MTMSNPEAPPHDEHQSEHSDGEEEEEAAQSSESSDGESEGEDSGYEANAGEGLLTLMDGDSILIQQPPMGEDEEEGDDDGKDIQEQITVNIFHLAVYSVYDGKHFC